jgi:pimeloyl-ACP methyl ester carboxylesterase
MWQPQLDALSDNGLLLAPDLPGFGRSRSEQAGLRSASDACAAMLSERGVRPIVVGVSYGGYVATVLAATNPGLVSGLVLSGVQIRVPTSAAYLQMALFGLIRPRSLAAGATIPRKDLAAEKRNLIGASRELGRVDLAPFLPRIATPTIVFAPARDRFVRGAIPKLAAAMPSARVVPLPDAGHLWTRDHPQPLINAIRGLSSTDPPATAADLPTT